MATAVLKYMVRQIIFHLFIDPINFIKFLLHIVGNKVAKVVIMDGLLLHQLPHTQNASTINIETSELLRPVIDFDYTFEEDDGIATVQEALYFWTEMVRF